MLRRSTSTRTASAVLAAGLGLALITAVAPASAAPASSDSAAAPVAASALKAAGPYAAAADASLLTLDLPSLSPALLPLTKVDLARSKANLESDLDLDANKAGAQRTSASAGTTGITEDGDDPTSVLGIPIEVQTNRASAPASEANEDILLDLDLSPLLDLPVIRTTALANWISDTECVASDTPLSYADQSLADLNLLGVGPGQSVVELDTDDADGAADTEASTFLSSIPGDDDARAVSARATTDITSANVLNGFIPGLDSLIEVDVLQTPNYVVSASGLPGGAKVEGADPAVRVSIGGEDLITLDTANQTTEALITDLVLGDLLDLTAPGLLVDLVNDIDPTGALALILGPVEDLVQTLLSELQPIARLSIPVSKTELPDGTKASVQASLLRVELLMPSALGATDLVRELVNSILGALGADIGGPLLSLDLGPVGATAQAPVGGITCGDPLNPLRELNKHASALEVAPGGTFEYLIAVPNRGPCALTDVEVVDVITGPAGFEIIDTEPDGTIEGGKVSFDLGNLAVNQTKNVTITVRVPAGAPNGATFDDVVTASGNCEGRPVTKDKRLDDIPRVTDDFRGPCNVSFSNKDASHIQVTPGQTFSYYVHAFNAGAEACNNITITDTLDSHVSFVSCNKGCTNDPADKVTWNLASIPPGSSTILAVVVRVDADTPNGTELRNTAVIAPDNGPPTTVNTRGPIVGPDSIPKDPGSPTRTPLPKTGSMVPTGMALLLGAGAYALYQVRRKAAIV